jgi:hypothetical protein
MTGPVAGLDKQMIYNNAGAAGGAEVYYVGGNVGIGTPETGEMLSIRKASAQEMAIKLGTDNTNQYIYLGQDAVGAAYLGTERNANLKFFANQVKATGISSPQMVLTSTGNVGIGTTEALNAMLDVNGNIRIRGTGTAQPPAASASYRGVMYLQKGSGTDPDKLYMCMMKSNQSDYQWVLVARGD